MRSEGSCSHESHSKRAKQGGGVRWEPALISIAGSCCSNFTQGIITPEGVRIAEEEARHWPHHMHAREGAQSLSAMNAYTHGATDNSEYLNTHGNEKQGGETPGGGRVPLGALGACKSGHARTCVFSTSGAQRACLGHAPRCARQSTRSEGQEGPSRCRGAPRPPGCAGRWPTSGAMQAWKPHVILC